HHRAGTDDTDGVAAEVLIERVGRLPLWVSHGTLPLHAWTDVRCPKSAVRFRLAAFPYPPHESQRGNSQTSRLAVQVLVPDGPRPPTVDRLLRELPHASTRQ